MRLWWHRHTWQISYSFEDDRNRDVLYYSGDFDNRFGHLVYQVCMSCNERKAMVAGYAPWLEEYNPPSQIIDWDYINFKTNSPTSPLEIYNGRVMYQKYGER